jgi:hypothetical protein
LHHFGRLALRAEFELGQIKGVGASKLQRYGAHVLAVLVGARAA